MKTRYKDVAVNVRSDGIFKDVRIKIDSENPNPCLAGLAFLTPKQARKLAVKLLVASLEAEAVEK